MVQPLSWNREHTLILIAELRKYKCLYNPQDENFTNNRMRLQKVNLIRDKLKSIRPNITINEIRRKIKSLKCQMWKEKQKLKFFKNTWEPEVVYEPTLWCYKELSFLLSVNDEETSQSNIDCLVKFEKLDTEEYRSIPDTHELNHNLEDSGSAVTPQIKFNTEEYGSISDTQELNDNFEDCGSGVTPEKKFNTEEYRSISDTQELNDNFEDCGSGVTPEKKGRIEVKQLEECGMAAFEFMKQYLENRRVKQPLEKEEEFCQYLCSILKRIKSEERFEDISLQIIALVNQTISEERNNCKPPYLRIL